MEEGIFLDTFLVRQTYFETKQNLNAEHIAKTFNIVYYFAEEEKYLEEVLPNFFRTQINQRPAILEIKTDGEVSAAIFREYYKSLSTNGR